jgi:translation initiation factor 1
MIMGKQKKSRSHQGDSDRVAYSEFATERSAATQRAVPDLPPSKQSLKVQASRKGRGGKTVTVISGFQHSPDQLKALAKKLKALCGTGGTAKEDSIEIQGDHADALVEALQQAGYTAKRSGG